MKKVHLRSYAKINLNLRVEGAQGGYHLLDSVVASIDMFDAISLSKRKDEKVTFQCSDPEIETIAYEKNTAVRAARAFMNAFGTTGVDIYVHKGIPVGAGLGGSSADIAGVLCGMKKLYTVSGDVAPIAATLSSDGAYQTVGGFARLAGKGDDATFYESKAFFYAVLVLPETPSSTADVFAEYDRGGYQSGDKALTDEAWIALQSLDVPRLGNALSNDLFAPACVLNPQIKEAYDAVMGLGPIGAVMSGSGSAVVGLFESKELVWWAMSRLKRKFNCYTVKVLGNPRP